MRSREGTLSNQPESNQPESKEPEPRTAELPREDRVSIGDSRRTSLAKAVSWRVVASLTTVLIAWAITGSIGAGAAIGGVEIVAKFGLYYGHERAWQRFN